jgi:outer membrane immunogenic protein
MKKLLVASAALVALIGTPALAADMALKAPPPPAPVCVWCGWYAGLNVGGAWDAGSSAATFAPSTAATAIFFANNEFPTSLSTDPKGVIGGGQIGYNWQASPNFVLGLEADIQGSGYKGTATAIPVPGPILFVPFATTVEQHSNWFGTVRGRAGFVATPNLLIYGTGGLAYGQTEVSFNTAPTGFACGPGFTCAAASSSTTRAGWTAGGGFEWMIVPHWSLKAEYLYVDLGTQSATSATTTAGPAFGFTASARFRENIARGGVNWHF